MKKVYFFSIFSLLTFLTLVFLFCMSVSNANEQLHENRISVSEVISFDKDSGLDYPVNCTIYKYRQTNPATVKEFIICRGVRGMSVTRL